MFNNAWLYNRKTSRVYKYCSKLAEVFESEIDPVMQGLGYCCGRKVRHRRSLGKLMFCTSGIWLQACVHEAVLVELGCSVSRTFLWTGIFPICISAVWVLSANPLLLWQAALHHTHRRHILQLPKQVNHPLSAHLDFICTYIYIKNIELGENVAFVKRGLAQCVCVIVSQAWSEDWYPGCVSHFAFFFTLLHCIVQT